MSKEMLEAIRRQCLKCRNGDKEKVNLCSVITCPLWECNPEKGNSNHLERDVLFGAIWMYCIKCWNCSPFEGGCDVVDCPLWDFHPVISLPYRVKRKKGG